MSLDYLHQKILSQTQILPNNIISVDYFLNHRMDVDFFSKIALEFFNYFKVLQPTIVVTVEASGIVPAFLVAQNFNINVIMIRKTKSLIMENGDYISTKSFSFTKNKETELFLNKNYITPKDRVLIIDDFLANGHVALGILDLIKDIGATAVGAGFIIEKSYLDARAKLQAKNPNLDIFSILRVESISHNSINILK